MFLILCFFVFLGLEKLPITEYSNIGPNMCKCISAKLRLDDYAGRVQGKLSYDLSLPQMIYLRSLVSLALQAIPQKP